MTQKNITKKLRTIANSGKLPGIVELINAINLISNEHLTSKNMLYVKHIANRATIGLKAEEIMRVNTVKRENEMSEDRMLKWFAFRHLPEHLQEVSKSFHDLAVQITENIEGGPERTVALRKLLEAKDAAVRAKLYPGG